MNKIISIKNVSCKINKKLSIYIDDMQINSGEFISINGRNGSGKTSFFEIILGTKFINTGEIEIYCGMDKISGFLSTSILDDVAVKHLIKLHSNNKNITDQNDIVIKMCVDSLWDKNYSNLSLGETQRVKLAICLLGEFDILLIDEPLTGLDDIWKKDILEIFQNLKDVGKTILCVTHDNAPFVDIKDKTYVFEDNKLIERKG